MTMPAAADRLGAHFERLYDGDADPWRVRERWYEQRKRALVLAALPQARYRHAYEAGCGNGEMTMALALRCDTVLAADLSAAALRLTGQRLRGAGQCIHVTLEQHRLPGDWPGDRTQAFDLIVLSEIAYYLEADELARVAAQSAATLAPGGTLVLCHWRAPFPDRRLSTEQAHGAFDASPGLHRLLRHDEADFLLEVWSNDDRSVAQREGLR